MNVFVNRGQISIPLLTEQTLSGNQFIDILKQFYFKEAGEVLPKSQDLWEVPVALFVTIRTRTTNKVFTVHINTQATLGFSDDVHQVRELEGYFLLIAEIQNLLEKNFHEKYREAMPTSVLQPMGFLETEERIGVHFQIIVEDRYESGTFILSDVNKSGTFDDISSVSTFTNLTKWSTMILPTLKIVGE